MPSRLESPLTLGCRLQEQGRWRECERAFRAALRAQPASVPVRLKLAEALIQQGKSAAARRVLAPLRRRHPEISRDGFRTLAYLSRFPEAFALGEALLKTDRSAEAVAFLSWPWVGVVPGQDEAEKHFAADAAALGAMIAEGVEPAWAHFYRGTLKRRALMDHWSWFEDLRTVLSFPREKYGWMHFEAARAMLYAEDLEGAVKTFGSYLEYMDGKDWSAFAYLGEAYACLGRREEAVAQFALAGKAAPPGRQGDVLAWLGQTLLWFGNIERALSVLAKAASLGAKYSHCWLGAAKVRSGRFEEALPHLARAIELKPWDTEAWVWRGEAKRLLGDLGGAVEDLTRAIAVNPNPWAFANRALARAAAGDRRGLREDYEVVKDDKTFLKARKDLRIGDRPDDAARLRVLSEGLRLNPSVRDACAYRRALWLGS